MFLETRLVSMEEFKTQRQTMETTIEELKRQIQQKEDAYRSALDQMEIALITFKNRFVHLDFSSFRTFYLQIKERSDSIS